jgi:tetratricopeptide (TPR) repeat protein
MISRVVNAVKQHRERVEAPGVGFGEPWRQAAIRWYSRLAGLVDRGIKALMQKALSKYLSCACGAAILALGAVQELGAEPALGKGKAPAVSTQAEAAFQFSTGKLLADNGDFRGAMEAYRRSSELDPSDPYALIELAKLQSYLAQMAGSGAEQVAQLRVATELADRAKALEPENVDILKIYAQVHLRLGEIDSGSASIALAQGAFEILRTKAPNDLNALTALGQLYMASGETERGAQILAEASAIQPGNRVILSMLVEAQLAAQKQPEATATLDRLLQLEPENKEQRIRFAELLSLQGDHERAIAAIEEHPAADRPFRMQQILAREYHFVGRNEEALAVLEASRERWTGNEGGERLRAAILIDLIRYRDALGQLQQVLQRERDPARRTQDSAVISRLHERLGECDQAVAVLEANLAEKETTERQTIEIAVAGILQRCGRSPEAQARLEKLVAMADPTDLPSYLQALSEILQDSGQTARAIAALDQVISLEDDQEVVTRIRLRTLFLAAQAKEWQLLLDRSRDLASQPDAELALPLRLLRADALAGLERFDEAQDLLIAKDAVATTALDGPQGALLVKRWELLRRTGKAEQAEKEIEERLKGADAKTLPRFAEAYQRLELHPKALPLLETMVKSDPAASASRFALAVSYEQMERHAEAISAFDALLQAEPGNAAALNYLGYLLAERGEQRERALELTRKAVSLEPDNGAYVDSLGWAYYQLGRLAEAREHLEWAARLVESDPTVHEHLGAVYLKLGLKDRAKASLQRALDLGSENKPEIERQLRSLEAS